MPINYKAIIANNVGKYYRLGIKEQDEGSLLKSVISFIRSPLRNYRTYKSLYNFKDIKSEADLERRNVLRALHDVSFEVDSGEVVGFIGHNGAGKSTLLKILCRITDPTFGRVEIRGRISSLLEVGTGFHPELTGRENVYLNGTILGMRKNEIDDRFDEIVEFSGIEKFIETPVKRYSSGMRVRLAFSVAAHLEPEILIVDEVLAVGDIEFQRKCLNKMKEFGGRGRTVLFVSHNMQAITRLCSRVIVLEHGQIVDDGPAEKVVAAYLTSQSGSMAVRQWDRAGEAPGNEVAGLVSISIKNNSGHITEAHDIREPMTVEMQFIVKEPGHVFMPNFHFIDAQGIEAFSTLDIDPKWRNKPRPAGRYSSIVKIPGNLMAEGLYSIRSTLITVNPIKVICNIQNSVSFTVVDSLEGNSARGDFGGRMGGVLRPKLEWETRYEDTLDWPQAEGNGN
ncbi:MAG: ATP-binding cassette domain-containing protein [Desulfobacteraceae bacterium]|nr:ATP-binding cassette domain-containing protein [Desulfobacteraceae bacterium]